MEFIHQEKMAVIKMSYAVILADGRVHPNEVTALRKLKIEMGFDSAHTTKAQQLEHDNALVTLFGMPHSKKKQLAKILSDIAISDNHLHEREMTLILDTFRDIGIGEETE